MTQVVVEHLVMAAGDGVLLLGREVVPLPDLADPVLFARDAVPGSYAHSTSWRWLDGRVILTFAHVIPVGCTWPATVRSKPLSVDDLEDLPVACHAVRHLHFLERTDPDVADLPGLGPFWDFAAEVIAHHHPAVAGMLSSGASDAIDFHI